MSQPPSRAQPLPASNALLSTPLPVASDLDETFDASEPSAATDDARDRLIRGSALAVGDSSSRSRHDDPHEPTTVHGVFQSSRNANDGVFANLSAKPERGEKLEEHPPVSLPFRLSNIFNAPQSYEQAAADATPPYWETTVLAPGLMSDEVYIDGLPVGSFFSFAWNGVISMAFELVGFLLTYLLHTTHAAKNGSRAGLGVTLINYGFRMRRGILSGSGSGTDSQYEQPSRRDGHDFDPSSASPTVGTSPMSDNLQQSHRTGEWLSYLLMIAGWIVLIKAVTDYVRARRHEQLVLQSPERGANVERDAVV